MRCFWQVYLLPKGFYMPKKVYWVMTDNPIYWLGSSKDDLSDIPEEARRQAGFQLRAIQRGQKPTDFKPMPSVGKGVEEIRIRTRRCLSYLLRR